MLLYTAAVVAEDFAFFTQMLRMLLALVRNIQPIRFLQGSLLVRVNIDVALDTFLSHVGPGVPAHPLPLAFRAFIFTETPLLSLIRGQAFTFGSSLRTVFDVVSFVEAKVAQVVRRRPFAGFTCLWGQREV